MTLHFYNTDKGNVRAPSYEGKKTFKVTGDTFSRRDKIKKAGGRWNPADKSWTITVFDDCFLFGTYGLVFTEVLPSAPATAKINNVPGVTTPCRQCGTLCFGECGN